MLRQPGHSILSKLHRMNFVLDSAVGSLRRARRAAVLALAVLLPIGPVDPRGKISILLRIGHYEDRAHTI